MDGNNNEFGRGLENFRRLIRQTRRRFFLSRRVGSDDDKRFISVVYGNGFRDRSRSLRRGAACAERVFRRRFRNRLRRDAPFALFDRL